MRRGRLRLHTATMGPLPLPCSSSSLAALRARDPFEEQRYEQRRDERRRQHAADHARAERMTAVGTGAGAQGQRQ